MGKLKNSHHSYDQQHLQDNQSKTQKPNKVLNKVPMKITYISSPVMVRACNASEFRAVVQELTGNGNKYSDKENKSSHGNTSCMRRNNEQDSTWISENEAFSDATMAAENHVLEPAQPSWNKMAYLEFEESHFWRELVLEGIPPFQSPSFV
ncbi:VQ motif-containing protein [Quillaja saponaria]|uniref:VQ motif-containing protein n=1 Tax=Quillaja saponaria TaxID=32244 RepID=A0AAD7Q290_QUISA|nr:VQ motif-containing protein [Quillaja saponaria]